MTWKGRDDERQHAHPSNPDAADGPRGSYFVDVGKLEPYVFDITHKSLARERGLFGGSAEVPMWWGADSKGEKRATWTRYNSISTGQVPLSSPTAAERERHRYVSSFDETVLWFEDLRELALEDVRSAVTAAIIKYEDRQGLTIAPSFLKGKLAGCLPLSEWAGLVTHGVKVTSDLMQTSDPHMNCYGFAAGVMMQLREAKARLPDAEEEFRLYLQEPIWRLNGYGSLEEVKWKEAMWAGSCFSKYVATSERQNVVLAPESPGQIWADNSVVVDFLKADPVQLRLNALEAWRSYKGGQRADFMPRFSVSREYVS